MITKNLIWVLFTITALSACSNPIEYEDPSVRVSVGDKALKITNIGFGRIYYFVVDRELLAVIDWGACFRGPSLSNQESVSILYEDIYGLNEPIKSGTEVMVFYWDDSNREDPEIKIQAVELSSLSIH